MLKLSTFASICRRHGHDFRVRFEKDASFAIIEDNCARYVLNDLTAAGASVSERYNSTIYFQLESLT